MKISKEQLVNNLVNNFEREYSTALDLLEGTTKLLRVTLLKKMLTKLLEDRRVVNRECENENLSSN